jgi:hypothetical protein
VVVAFAGSDGVALEVVIHAGKEMPLHAAVAALADRALQEDARLRATRRGP